MHIHTPVHTVTHTITHTYTQLHTWHCPKHTHTDTNAHMPIHTPAHTHSHTVTVFCKTVIQFYKKIFCTYIRDCILLFGIIRNIFSCLHMYKNSSTMLFLLVA